MHDRARVAFPQSRIRDRRALGLPGDVHRHHHRAERLHPHPQRLGRRAHRRWIERRIRSRGGRRARPRRPRLRRNRLTAFPRVVLRHSHTEADPVCAAGRSPCRRPDLATVWAELAITRSVRDLVGVRAALLGVRSKSIQSRRTFASHCCATIRWLHCPLTPRRSPPSMWSEMLCGAYGLDARDGHPPGLNALADPKLARNIDTTIAHIRAVAFAWVEQRIGRALTEDDLIGEQLAQAARGRTLTERATSPTQPEPSPHRSSPSLRGSGASPRRSASPGSRR